MKKTIQRIIIKDIKSIKEKKINDLGIYIEFNENNLLNANAIIIGPKDSSYHNAILFFRINFPVNYPFVPPDIKYIKSNNIRIHPNFYISGKVCLSILGTWSGPGWSSAMDISDVFITMVSLLDNNPISHEPGYEKIVSKETSKYNKIIKYNSLNSLFIDRFMYFYDNKKDYEYFYNIIKEYLMNNDKEIKETIHKYKNKDINLYSNLYNTSVTINHKDLINKYIKIKNII